jgi:hypothetical protein
MTDLESINDLFQDSKRLPKFAKKEFIKIHPENTTYTEDTGIKYNCRNIADRLVLYHEGYIMLNVRVSRTALADNDQAVPKNSPELVAQSIIRLNNQELDNTRNNNVYVEILNAIEYSHDYSKIAEENMYTFDTTYDHQNNVGEATRKSMLPNVAHNQLNYSVAIPLTYLSTFFRTLNAPLINNEVEIEVSYRLTNSVRRLAGGALTVAIQSSVLIVPAVELNAEYQSKFLQLLNKGHEIKIVWNRIQSHTRTVTANQNFDEQLEPSINGVRRLYVVVVPTAYHNNQTHIGSLSEVKLSNTNIEIDSINFYQHDITTDREHYALTKECFNMQGNDPNTGALLSYSNWLNVHRYYCFDLSRQKVFDVDPRKAQSIRFRANISAAGTAYFFMLREQITMINLTDAFKTRTV